MTRRALARTVKRGRAALGPSALILTYHRVADLAEDPQLLAVGTNNFAEQMQRLREHHEVFSLADLVEAKRHGRLAQGAIAVTFDDGYADNLTSAAPILESCAIPATVFVASGYVGSGREFWWDELGRLLLLGPPSLDELHLEADGLAFDWHAAALPVESQTDGERWNVLRPPTNAAQQLYLALCGYLRGLDPRDRERALEQLHDTLRAPRETRESHRPLTSQEVVALDASPLIEVGAHTVGHPVLASLGKAEQNAEIESGRTYLESLCARRIEAFSYPYGGRHDFDSTSVEIVREQKFSYACANYPGLVKSWTDGFRLPRHVVRNWDGDTFEHAIESWLRGEPGPELT